MTIGKDMIACSRIYQNIYGTRYDGIVGEYIKMSIGQDMMKASLKVLGII